MSKRTTGLHTHRFIDNPEEKAFADAWTKMAERPADTLAWLMGCAGARGHATDRDHEVAATVMQWLGSPVGRGFLRDLGYVKREMSGE